MSLRLNINSGAALLIYIGCTFGMLFIVGHYANLIPGFPIVFTSFTGAFGGFLAKRAHNNHLRYMNGNGGQHENQH